MERNSALPYLDLAETLQARMLADQACASDGTLGVLDAHIVTLEQALAKAEALSEQRRQEAEAATNRVRLLEANIHRLEEPLARAEAFVDQRRQEAEAAAERIGAAETVCFSGGTTTTEVARRIRGRSLTVVTNAVNIASELVVSETNRLVVIAGVARPQTYELIGPLAEQTLTGLNVDVLFLGCDGITAAGLSTHDEIEARTDRTMVERAARTIIVADSSKIGRSALAAICPLAAIDELITDTAAPAEEVAKLRAGGIEVIQV